MSGLHVEVILAVVYALFLLVTAVVLERAARHTHGRAKMYRHRGFRFHRHLNVWECPAGEHLPRRETDHVRQLVRYRARAEKCNSCALKAVCTDSPEGREIVHSTEDWLDTEVGRFHRGLSLGLLGLAALMLLVFGVRHHAALDLLALTVALAAVLATAAAFARSFVKEAFRKDAFRGQAIPPGQAGLHSASPWTRDAEDRRRGRPRF